MDETRHQSMLNHITKEQHMMGNCWGRIEHAGESGGSLAYRTSKYTQSMHRRTSELLQTSKKLSQYHDTLCAAPPTTFFSVVEWNGRGLGDDVGNARCCPGHGIMGGDTHVHVPDHHGSARRGSQQQGTREEPLTTCYHPAFTPPLGLDPVHM
jgi:hypothetical protein